MNPHPKATVDSSYRNVYFLLSLLVWCKFYLRFFLVKPGDRLSSFPWETLGSVSWLSGSIWMCKCKVSDYDRQQSEWRQACLAFESAGLLKISFIEGFWRGYVSYTTRLLLIWRQCSSFTKNKPLNSDRVWHTMKTEKQVGLQKHNSP